MAVAGTIKGSSIQARNELKTLPTSMFALKKTSTLWLKCQQRFQLVSAGMKKITLPFGSQGVSLASPAMYGRLPHTPVSAGLLSGWQ